MFLYFRPSACLEGKYLKCLWEECIFLQHKSTISKRITVMQRHVAWRFYKPFQCTAHFYVLCIEYERPCDLVVRVPGYRSRGPGSDSRRYHIFWKVVGLERGPLSLVSTIGEILERKSSGFGLENQNYGRSGSAALSTRHPPLSTKVGTNFTD
jgi:hypothetical protein